MNESKRLIKNTGIIAIGNLSTKLVSFLLLPLYTSLLSTSEYGIVDYIISISIFIVPFSTLLMDEAIFRFLIDCKSEEEQKCVFSVSAFLACIGILAYICIATPLFAIRKYEFGTYLTLYVVLSSVTLMINAFMRGVGRTDQYALFNFLQSLFAILLNILFIVGLHRGAEGMLLSSIISMGCISAVFIVRFTIWRYIDFRAIHVEEAKRILEYSLPLIPNKVSWSIINMSDRLLIMNIIGSSASGLYAVSYKFPNLMDTIYGFFFQSWKESSARVMGQSDQDSFYQKVYGYLRRFLFTVVLLLTAFMPLIFKLLIHESFRDAILYVPILLLGTYYSNISGFYGGVFTAYKETKIIGTTTLVAAICNIALHIALIHYIGLYAAAISTVVSCFVVYIYRRRKVKKYVKLDEEPRATVVSYLTWAIVIFCYYSNSIGLTIAAMVIAMVYAIFANKELITIVLNDYKGKLLRKAN